MSEPLNHGQMCFNQRLLAEHCMTEDAATELYQELRDHYELGETFRDAMRSSNHQLQYLGLEIVAISIPGADKPLRHYAIVNKFPDDVAKQAFQPVLFQPPQQQAFVKAVLEKLVHDGTAARSTLLNVKNDIEDKITLGSAEDVLERLVEEKWIIEGTSKHRRGSNASELILGPRTYCELSYLLTGEFGMDKEDLPQQIVM